MKRYEFNFDDIGAQWFFKPIRTKADVLVLLMHAVKIMLVNSPPPEGRNAGKLVLLSSKMSRLFFETDKKIFSVAFPFFSREVDGALQFYAKNCENVDSRVTSQVLALVRDDLILERADVLDFATPVDEVSKYDSDMWALFRDLLLHEDGYIRYDHDEERLNGDIHPLHHLDIFYSSSSTFKLGLKRSLPLIGFQDLLDIQTACQYVGGRSGN